MMREKTTQVFEGLDTFLGLEYTKEITEDTDVVIYGMPMDIGTTNRPGTRFGPRVLRKYGYLKPYDEGFDMDILEDFKAIDYGDFPMRWGYDYIEDYMESVIKNLGKILEHDVLTIGIGGDHTLAYPELAAIKKKYGRVGLIHFDSHTDTWPTEKRFGQTGINHATPFRLAMENDCLEPGRIIQVGMRGGLGSVHDHDYAFSHGFQMITANELHDMGMRECAVRIREIVEDYPVFVTFDIDFLDPAYAPGTGTPVIGGFTTEEALTLLREALPGLSIIGMDLVEVSQENDPNEVTRVAAQAILKEFLTILSYNKKNRN